MDGRLIRRRDRQCGLSSGHRSGLPGLTAALRPLHLRQECRGAREGLPRRHSLHPAHRRRRGPHRDAWTGPRRAERSHGYAQADGGHRRDRQRQGADPALSLQPPLS